MDDWFNGVLNGPAGDQGCNFASGAAKASIQGGRDRSAQRRSSL